MSGTTKSNTWHEFSDNLLKYMKLPYGHRFRLVRRGGKVVRGDIIIDRYLINAKNIPKVKGTLDVKTMLGIVNSLVETDIAKHHFKLALFDPTGKQVRGNTLVKTLRDLPPRKTEEQKLKERCKKLSIDIECDEMLNQLDINLECMENDYGYYYESICRGHLMAMVGRYGREMIEEQLQAIAE